LDVDNPQADLSKADLIGGIETSVAKVVGSKFGRFEVELGHRNKGPGKYGTLIVIAETQKGRKGDKVCAKLQGVSLAAKDGMFGKSDPYYVVKRFRRGTEEVAFEFKSPVIKSNLNPVWEPAYWDFSELCNGNMDEKFRLEVWDEDMASSPDMIGWLDVSLNELLKKEPLKLNDRPGGHTADPGSIQVLELVVHRTPDFLDYIMEGCNMTFSVAVDFTASNKAIQDPASLHYIQCGVNNQYQEAIEAVAPIVLAYDKDNKVGAMGFGAVLPGQEDASHCFPLKLGASNGDIEVDGANGLMDAYLDAVKKVKLYGPTNFADVINRTALWSKECQKYAYNVLLILTDGDITDMPQTIAAICAASNLPMSIIVIGVGNEDFEEMDRLDADKGKLEDESGNKASRDIVQFVPFKKCSGAVDVGTKVLVTLFFFFLCWDQGNWSLCSCFLFYSFMLGPR